MSEWINWNGGGMSPVNGEVMVEVECKSGKQFTRKASHFIWRHIACVSDIARYRLIGKGDEK